MLQARMMQIVARSSGTVLDYKHNYCNLAAIAAGIAPCTTVTKASLAAFAASLRQCLPVLILLVSCLTLLHIHKTLFVRRDSKFEVVSARITHPGRGLCSHGLST